MIMEPRSQEEVFPRTVSMHSCSLAAVAGSSMYFSSAKLARLCFLHYAVYTFRSTFDVRTNTLPICSFSSSIAAMSFSLI